MIDVKAPRYIALGYRVDLSIVAANVQRADVRRIRIVTVRANDNGLPFSDITGESHSRRRSLKEKKKKKNTAALRSPAGIARFRFKSPLSPIPDVRFFSLDRFYCVTCSIRDSESLCSLKWLARVDCKFIRCLIIIYTDRHYLLQTDSDF